MEKWELIVCFMNGTRELRTIEVNLAQIDGPDDVASTYIANYCKDKDKDQTLPEIAFVGVYHTENIEDRECRM